MKSWQMRNDVTKSNLSSLLETNFSILSCFCIQKGNQNSDRNIVCGRETIIYTIFCWILHVRGCFNFKVLGSGSLLILDSNSHGGIVYLTITI